MKCALRVVIILACLVFLFSGATEKVSISIPRVKYSGGSDWYNGPTEIPNLLEFFEDETGIETEDEDFHVDLKSLEIFNYPFLFITGHGPMKLTELERDNFRRYLEGGGFVYVDDDYGLDASFRKEVNKIFPDSKLTELAIEHEIFDIYFEFPEGLPRIHDHYEGPPVAYGIFDENGRMMLLYTYNTNISDGWDSPGAHNDPEHKREQALKFGVNILILSLTR